MKNIGIKSLFLLTVCLMPFNVNAQSNDAARALVRLDGLEAQIRDLTNRIEILESENAGLKDALANVLSNAPAKSVTPITQINSPAPTAQEAQTALKETQAAANNAQPAGITTPNSINENIPATAAQTINNAKLSIQQGSYNNAENILVKFTTDNPNAPEAPEAYWLLGETRFVQQAWGPAAQAYVQYLTIAPTGPKVSDVLVRIAGTFRELGDNGQRCKALSEYKKRTPNPSAVLKARADAEIAKASCP